MIILARLWFSVVSNYTYMDAMKLRADYRINSQNVWGFYMAYDNNPYKNIPAHY